MYKLRTTPLVWPVLLQEEDAKRTVERLLEEKFDFNDFLNQWKAMNNMGGMQMLKMMPGFNKVGGQAAGWWLLGGNGGTGDAKEAGTRCVLRVGCGGPWAMGGGHVNGVLRFWLGHEMHCRGDSCPAPNV